METDWFKESIHSIISDECYIVERGVKASLYTCDYGYGEENVVLVLSTNDYLARTTRELGHIELKKRLLKELGFRIRIIGKV